MLHLLRERRTATSIRTANRLLKESERTDQVRGCLLKQLERAETLYLKGTDQPLVADGKENSWRSLRPTSRG
ncbi:MAG: hypothetical protein LH645_00955 [Actinomycetia bacterium]|nr:hypothetical protein [Actinomycetes bacterium]